MIKLKSVFHDIPWIQRQLIIIGLAGVLMGVTGVLIAEDISWTQVFDNVHWTFGYSVGALFAWQGVRIARNKGQPSTPWWFFTLGLVSYTIAQLIWAFQVYIDWTPFPGPSDPFFLMLGPAFAAGIYAYGRPHFSQAEWRIVLLDAGLLLLTMLIATIVLYLPRQGNHTLFQLCVMAAYPIGFWSAASLGLMMMLEMRARFNFQSLLIIFATLADIALWNVWNLRIFSDALIDGSFVNIMFSPIAILLGLGAFIWQLEPSVDRRWDSFCIGFLRMLPLILVILAATGIIASLILPGVTEFAQITALTGGLLVVVLATIRQSLTLKERDLLLAAQKETLKGKSLLKTVIDTAPIRVFWKDRDSVYLGCNRAFAEDAGLNHPDELIGKTDYDVIWAREAANYQADDREVMESGQAKLGYEESQTTPDGRSMTSVRTSKTPLRDETGKVIGVLGLYEDISERKRIEHELEQYRLNLEGLVEMRTREAVEAKNIAEQASQAKSQFLSSMSHELRTPLNAILGYSQLLGLNSELPEEVLDQAHEIERSGHHLLSLVNDLIDLARIEDGKLDFSIETVSVKSVVRDSLNMVTPLAQKQGVSLINAIDEEEVTTVRADFSRLRQILINFLSNAIKYNRAQGGEVSLRLESHDDRIRILVVDNGVGIPADRQNRIFIAFDRLGRETGTVEGSGIGLVISKRIVESMGGSIGFESVEHKGSTFWIELPAGSSMEVSMSKNMDSTGLEASTVNPGSGQRILLAEDNLTNQRLAVQILTTLGHSVDVVSNGIEAVEYAAKGDYDLILMDCQMPVMDGYEATAAIRGEESGRRVPVIAMTANVMKYDREKCLAAGMDDYISKPINIVSFQQVLNDWLTNSSAGVAGFSDAGDTA